MNPEQKPNGAELVQESEPKTVEDIAALLRNLSAEEVKQIDLSLNTRSLDFEMASRILQNSEYYKAERISQFFAKLRQSLVNLRQEIDAQSKKELKSHEDIKAVQNLAGKVADLMQEVDKEEWSK